MAGSAKAPGCGEYNRKNALARQIYTIRRGGLLPNYHILGWKALPARSKRSRLFATLIPGKLKGCAPSARTSRCTKNQHAAQQSRYIRRTATLESTASFSNVPVMDRAKASTAYVMIATSGER